MKTLLVIIIAVGFSQVLASQKVCIQKGKHKCLKNEVLLYESEVEQKLKDLELKQDQKLEEKIKALKAELLNDPELKKKLK